MLEKTATNTMDCKKKELTNQLLRNEKHQPTSSINKEATTVIFRTYHAKSLKKSIMMGMGGGTKKRGRPL